MKAQRNERGQALVLIVLAIVALFGIAALAVDGGRVYSERRRAQNAADSAAYAAAMAAIQKNPSYTYFQAAVDQAKFNDYEAASVEVNNPPLNGPYAGDSNYYEVIITTEIDPAFAQIVTDQPFVVEAYAVAHAHEEDQVSSGNVIHALEDEMVGIEFKGSFKMTVTGGNIFSNAGMTNKGVAGSGEVWLDSEKTTQGHIYYSNNICDGCEPNPSNPNSMDLNPVPEKSSGPQYVAPVPEPVCPVTAGTQTGNTMTPGTYNSDPRINGNGTVTMQPGMYCFKDGMTLNGGAKLVGKGVFLVLLGGKFTLNGGSEMNLTRPDDLVDGGDNQWGGMLFYAPPGSNKTGQADDMIEFNGNGKARFAGTIFAPEHTCVFAGNNNAIRLNSNIVCSKILFSGNPTFDINYVQGQNYQLAPYLELSK